MRRFLLIIGGCVLAVVTGIFGAVRAQEATTVNDMDIDITIRTDEALSGHQQVSWVEAETIRAREIYFRVQNMLDQARKEKDTLKITCLNDKLTQIHVNLRGIEERTDVLKSAVQAGDNTTASQNFTILKIYVSRVRSLRAEAENCLGEVDVVLGETETTVTIEEDITVEDPTHSDIPEDLGVDQNEHASGYY